MERTRIRMFGRAEAQAATCACMKRAVGASDEAERVVAAAISEYYSNIAVVCTLRLSIRMFDLHSSTGKIRGKSAEAFIGFA